MVVCFYLRPILVRFVLALALKYLLTPLVDILACHGTESRVKLPRGVAIIVALILTAGGLALLGTVVARSVGNFAANADVYSKRVEQLIEAAVNASTGLQTSFIGPAFGNVNLPSNQSEVKDAIFDMARHHLSISSLIVKLLGTAAHMVENSIYILLFLAFLLPSSKPGGAHAATGDVHAHADEQIYIYLRGKVSIAAFVAICSGFILWCVRLKLWLVFATLTFWLNFVPNVGMALGVLLPMPLVVLDPHFSLGGILVAFLGPLAVGLVAKDVLEPVLIGRSTSLTPVAVLLSVMLWGCVWGVTGMVLAVPMTAVLRIHLSYLEHPLPRYFALVLAGRNDGGDGDDGGSATETA